MNVIQMFGNVLAGELFYDKRRKTTRLLIVDAKTQLQELINNFSRIRIFNGWTKPFAKLI